MLVAMVAEDLLLAGAEVGRNAVRSGQQPKNWEQSEVKDWQFYLISCAAK
jgi:hypothetical protein